MATSCYYFVLSRSLEQCNETLFFCGTLCGIKNHNCGKIVNVTYAMDRAKIIDIDTIVC
jgi:hypothetical protein